MITVTQDSLTRQELLSVWLKRNNLKLAAISRALEITKTTCSRLLNSETVSTWRHGQLVKLGIPVELLPTPLDIKPGPKPRRPQQFMDENSLSGISNPR